MGNKESLPHTYVFNNVPELKEFNDLGTLRFNVFWWMEKIWGSHQKGRKTWQKQGRPFKGKQPQVDYI